LPLAGGVNGLAGLDSEYARVPAANSVAAADTVKRSLLFMSASIGARGEGHRHRPSKFGHDKACPIYRALQASPPPRPVANSGRCVLQPALADAAATSPRYRESQPAPAAARRRPSPSRRRAPADAAAASRQPVSSAAAAAGTCRSQPAGASCSQPRPVPPAARRGRYLPQPAEAGACCSPPRPAPAAAAPADAGPA
jgi:hypothetical protein